ncbi:hypothetical protein L3V83_12235 [Thiotrichales bacterium 19X7-9]|nr:hypothetical protein [Thiotrichales bacterium 19X7-9]
MNGCKRLIKIIAIIVMSLSFSAYSLAKESKEVDRVNLYAKANSDQVIKQVSPSTKLIKVYQKDGWVKVGDPQDGRVGWVNLKQYNQALEAFYQPDIQTVFISRSIGKDHKPQLNVVAYKNGKQVSEKEAQALYQKLKHKQNKEMKQWQSFNQELLDLQRDIWQDTQPDWRFY